jgi:hypothetical protein
MNLNFKFSLKNKLDETGDGVEYVRWKSLVLCTGYQDFKTASMKCHKAYKLKPFQTTLVHELQPVIPVRVNLCM